METTPRPSPQTKKDTPFEAKGTSQTRTQTESITPNLVPVQLAILAIYPFTVLLGILSNHPRTSYFAQKDNFVNVLFLKMSWGWTTLAYLALVSHVPQQVNSLARYAVASIWWYLVTQWCFGPPIMDKVFRGTGGICEFAKDEEFPGIFTSAVCRSSGGAWNGGHDLSGHIFILTHASLFLWWELLPLFPVPRFLSTPAAKINFAMLVLWWFSLLNTATYFHTILEKVTGLVVGIIGWYLVDVLTPFALGMGGITN